MYLMVQAFLNRICQPDSIVAQYVKETINLSFESLVHIMSEFLNL